MDTGSGVAQNEECYILKILQMMGLILFFFIVLQQEKFRSQLKPSLRI